MNRKLAIEVLGENRLIDAMDRKKIIAKIGIKKIVKHLSEEDKVKLKLRKLLDEEIN